MSKRMKSIVIALSVCATAFLASSPALGVGSELHLVKDINAGASCTVMMVTGPCGGVADQFRATAVGSTLFFTANDGLSGLELWKTDGSQSGTVLVKDINPGTNCDNFGVNGPCGSGITNLTAVGSVLYFAADNGTNGSELWKSDGTTSGTVMVADVYPGSCTINGASGPCSSRPSKLTAVGSNLFFGAVDATHGNELWKSDGTNSGTVLVKEINTATGCTDSGSVGPCYGLDSTTFPFKAVGNTMYFPANNGTDGFELWKSDGTTSGTVMVKDINTSTSCNNSGCSGFTGELEAVGNTLYFSADDGVNGSELWKSDGTNSGTVMIKDVDPSQACDFGGRPGPCGGVSGNVFILGTTVLFKGSDGVNGYELWKSDGTSSGTVMVKNINTGASCTSFGRTSPCGGFSMMNAGNAIVAGSYFFFLGDDGANGTELWKSDGTTAGTVMVKDINTGASCTSFGVTGPCGGVTAGPGSAVVAGNTYYFTANDGTYGNELWMSDGTSAGTVMIKDINTGLACTSFGTTGPCGGITTIRDAKFAVGNSVYFQADDGTTGTELWAFNGNGNGSSPSSSSSSTSPTTTTIASNSSSATTVPAVTTTTTTIPSITKSSITSSSIAKIANIAVPAGAKVALKVSSSSSKICKVSGGTVKKLKPGNCVVTVTVTPKKGKSKSATAKMAFK